ncbi:MAG: hypothetical protein ACO1NO_07380 [Burkholderiaceae bacterium]
MDKQKILFLFQKEADISSQCDPFSLASMFAECMSSLSDRLTDEELDKLIRVGAGIYHCGVREYGKGVPVEDLLPASECWEQKIKSSLYE